MALSKVYSPNNSKTVHHRGSMSLGGTSQMDIHANFAISLSRLQIKHTGPGLACTRYE